MLIEIRTEPFNGLQEIQAYQTSLDMGGRFGATASFIGSMREFNEDRMIKSMTLEHYPEMTEKHLRSIAEQAIKKWRLLELLILHRVGNIKISDDIVVVACWSVHRKEAFESCRMIMEDLKSTAPFWKKEESVSGSHWVDKNTAGF